MQKKSKLANPVPFSPLYINIGIGSSVGRRREFKEFREVKEFREFREFREGAINLLIEDCRYNARQKCRRWVVLDVHQVLDEFMFAIVSCQKL